ncbi:DUF6212 domain-containing protein [Methylobacterium sp. ID0610]
MNRPDLTDGICDPDVYRTPCIMVYEDEARDIAQCLSGEVVLIEIPNISTGEIVSELVDTQSGSAISPLSCIAGVLTQHEDRIEDLLHVREGLRKFGFTHLPEPRLVPARHTSAQNVNINIVSLDTTLAQSSLITSLSRQLAQLRKHCEELQNRYHDLEIYLDRQQLQPFDAVFQAEPMPEAGKEVVDIANLGMVGQILPVSSRGIIGVSLYIAQAGSTSDNLTLVLRAMESDQVLGRWTVPGRSLKLGWNTFGLERSLGGLRRTVRLELHYSGEGTAPQIGLSEIQPIERYRLTALDTGSPIANRHLALIVWAGLPGMMSPDWINSVKRGSLRERQIKADTLLHAQIRTSGSRFNQINKSDVTQSSISAQIHENDSLSIVIPRALRPNTVRVSAQVSLTSSAPCTATVQLRAALTHSIDDAEARSLNSGQIESSEILTISSDETVYLNIYIAEENFESGNILISSKMLRGDVGSAHLVVRGLTVMEQSKA